MAFPPTVFAVAWLGCSLHYFLLNFLINKWHKYVKSLNSFDNLSVYMSIKPFIYFSDRNATFITLSVNVRADVP